MSMVSSGLSQPNGSSVRFVVAVLVLAISVIALAGAYYFQYVLKLPPCELCLMQRWPFYAAVPLAAAAAWTSRRGPAASKALLAIVGIGFLVGTGLAAFHAGVEWKFWPGLESCSGSLTVAGDADEFLQRLQNVQIVSCTEAAWRFAGLSLAGWNVPLSLALALVSLFGAARRTR